MKQKGLAILLMLTLFGLFIYRYKSDYSENTKKQKHKPNIIYILADDLGYGDLSCYGQKIFSTPNIDRLAEGGMRFFSHYSGCTVCSPSRSSLMTGLHTGHTPIRGNKGVQPEGQTPMDSEVVTIAEVLKTVGYKTGAFGKWGLGTIDSEGDPLNQGFDEFYGYNCQTIAHKYYPTHLWHNKTKVILDGNELKDTAIYAQDLIQEEAIRFIQENKDTSFFLYIPYLIPHAELLVPNDSIYQGFKSKFPEEPYVNPSGDYGTTNVHYGRYCSQEYPKATFVSMVTRLDLYVGEIMDKLCDLGLDNNTVIMFASDNGPHDKGGASPKYFNSNAGLRGIKRDLYEGGIRTAFIVSWKGVVKPGSVSNHLSAFWDVLPTCADIAQAKIPENLDGITFLPTLLDKKNQQSRHDFLYFEFHEQGGKQAVRMGNWKAVRLNMSCEPNSPIELYNLNEDTIEAFNVAAHYPKIVLKIDSIMKAEHRKSEKFLFQYEE